MTAWPALISRSAWGANESLRACGPNYADGVHIVFLHHIDTGNGYTPGQTDDLLRSIYSYAVQVRGFCDTPYNYFVDTWGRMYVGRYGGSASPVIPGSQMGFNTGSASMAALGSFEHTTPPGAIVAAIERLIAWRLDLPHLPPTGWTWRVSAGGPNTRYPAGKSVLLPIVTGHRQTGYTDCPGQRLYDRMPEIRKAAWAIGRPKIFRPWRSADHVTPFQGTVEFKAFSTDALSWHLEIVSDDTGDTVSTRTGLGRIWTWCGTAPSSPASRRRPGATPCGSRGTTCWAAWLATPCNT